MDGISAFATLQPTIATLQQGLWVIYTLGAAVVNASKSSQQVLNETKLVRSVLQELKTVLSRSGDGQQTGSFSQLTSLIKECEELSNKLTADVERVKRKSLFSVRWASEALKWLTYVDCSHKHNTFRKKRQENTCRWIFEDGVFSNWRDSPEGSLLWLHGKRTSCSIILSFYSNDLGLLAGAGKSVLASAVIEKFQEQNVPLAYFYCDFQKARDIEMEDVLRSLLGQFLQKTTKEWLPLFIEFEECMSGRLERPDGKALCEWLLRAARLHERPVVVIDALDECEDDTLKELLEILPCMNDGRLRLFLTSRNEYPIPEVYNTRLKGTFPSSYSIPLEQRSQVVSDDMQIFITKRFQCGRLQRWQGEILQNVESRLLEKADGMFRWVQCQLDRLDQCMKQSEIEMALNTLPRTLHDTYDSILAAVGKKEFGKSVVREALVWLVAASGPLHIEVLVEALKIKVGQPIIKKTDSSIVDKQGILEVCSSLVSFDEATKMLTLSHASVKFPSCTIILLRNT
ncbi:hypothetical protein ID866_7106 [Astraeus odoratus]|nr:hypothetical protein ID866_7106 [Astraeus odoratus]